MDNKLIMFYELSLVTVERYVSTEPVSARVSVTDQAILLSGASVCWYCLRLW